MDLFASLWEIDSEEQDSSCWLLLRFQNYNFGGAIHSLKHPLQYKMAVGYESRRFFSSSPRLKGRTAIPSFFLMFLKGGLTQSVCTQGGLDLTPENGKPRKT